MHPPPPPPAPPPAVHIAIESGLYHRRGAAWIDNLDSEAGAIQAVFEDLQRASIIEALPGT